MRKVLLVCACALLGLVSVFAQNEFKQGVKVVNLGVGIGGTLYTGSGYSTKVPPLSGSFEVSVKDNLFDEKSSLGIGGLIGYTSSEYKYAYSEYNFKYKYTDIVLGVRGAIHYCFIEKLDTYAGLTLGYDIVSGTASGTYAGYSATSSGLFLGAYLGARYYFSDNWAAMGELGYDISVLRLGVAYKF